jgi:hypothetical protein
MKNLFFILFILVSFLYSQDDTYFLEVKLAKLDAKLQSSKLVLNGAITLYRESLINGTSIEIEKYRANFINVNKLHNDLLQEHKKTRKQIKEIKALKVSNKVSKIVNRPLMKTVQQRLTVGWNAFSIPVNVPIPSSNPYLGNHSVIWGFNSITQKWIKNPPTLLPARGYYIYIISGGTNIILNGLSFSTDLGSIIRKDKTWYFIGTSEDIKNIDYTVYKIIKYTKDIPTINPPSLNIGDTFWAYRL